GRRGRNCVTKRFAYFRGPLGRLEYPILHCARCKNTHPNGAHHTFRIHTCEVKRLLEQCSLVYSLCESECWESCWPAGREPASIRSQGNGPNRPCLSAGNTGSSTSYSATSSIPVSIRCMS